MSPGAVKDEISTSQLLESAPFGRSRSGNPGFETFKAYMTGRLAVWAPVLLNQGGRPGDQRGDRGHRHGLL